jgi:hypothetical protein
MTTSSGHRVVSYTTEDKPAIQERGEKLANDERVQAGLVGLGRIGRFHARTSPGASPGPGWSG